MNKSVVIREFPDTPALRDPIIYTLNNYGHLVKEGEDITAKEFARRLGQTDRLEARVMSALLLKHMKE